MELIIRDDYVEFLDSSFKLVIDIEAITELSQGFSNRQGRILLVGDHIVPITDKDLAKIEPQLYELGKRLEKRVDKQLSEELDKLLNRDPEFKRLLKDLLKEGK